MVFQLALLREVPRAVSTLMVVLRMRLADVFFQLCSLGERACTALAGEALVAMVNTLVATQVSHPRKLLVTLLAGEGLGRT